MHCFSLLFSPSCQPSVEPSLWEAVLFMGVCGYLPAGVGPFLSLTHFFFLLFFFLFSSVLVPAKPFLFTAILSDFRELFREEAAHRMRTRSSSAPLDGMCFPEQTHSRRCCGCRPSLQLTTKGEPPSLSNFFVRGGFQAMNKTTPRWILTDVRRIRQMNDGRWQESRDLTLAALFTESRCRQTSDMGDMQHRGTFSTRKWLH